MLNTGHLVESFQPLYSRISFLFIILLHLIPQFDFFFYLLKLYLLPIGLYRHSCHTLLLHLLRRVASSQAVWLNQRIISRMLGATLKIQGPINERWPQLHECQIPRQSTVRIYWWRVATVGWGVYWWTTAMDLGSTILYCLDWGWVLLSWSRRRDPSELDVGVLAHLQLFGYRVAVICNTLAHLIVHGCHMLQKIILRVVFTDWQDLAHVAEALINRARCMLTIFLQNRLSWQAIPIQKVKRCDPELRFLRLSSLLLLIYGCDFLLVSCNLIIGGSPGIILRNLPILRFHTRVLWNTYSVRGMGLAITSRGWDTQIWVCLILSKFM